MASKAKTLALNLDGSVHPIQFVDPADAERLSGSLAEGRQVRIQVAADGDPDTEGHALSKSAVARLRNSAIRCGVVRPSLRWATRCLIGF